MNENDANPNMEQKCPQCGAPLPSGVLAGLCPACLLKQGATADTAAGADFPTFQPPGLDEISRMFPQLEIIELLGKGGMGAVYKARQPGLDRIVAVKILPAQIAEGNAFVGRFNREARALARLSHPNIVAVYEFGQVNNLPFFIMEYVDGLNLRQLEQAGKLTPREALQIVPQICDALQFAHEEGIVHRDIKPENILLDKKGRVKIADFGIAKILRQEADVAITETGGSIGTPHYMAPEQMEKPTTVDHRADIFSLGVVFYEMLTGELPLGKFGPPSSRKVEVDVRLDEVVLRALEKDPNLRYQQVSQVKTAVDTIAGSTGTPPPLASATPDIEAMAQEIIARDYQIEIGSCVRRGWALLKGNFWPIVGINALMVALLSFVGSIGGQSYHGTDGLNPVVVTEGLSLLVWGPLMGGLYLYLLKKIRKQKTTVETAFTGFSQHFLHLFLAGFVTALLTGIGFFCLILPGIYLVIAWAFSLPLVIDKQLDFWSAMELSRKVVTKHWWKFFGLGIVSVLLLMLGVLCCGIGVFVTMPLVTAAWMFAYDDVFGSVSAAPAGAGAGLGPFGTVVSPGAGAPPPPNSGTPPPPIMPGSPAPRKNIWTPTTKIGLAVVALVVVIFLITSIHDHAKARAEERRAAEFSETLKTPAAETAEAQASDSTASADATASAAPATFGPVIEQEIHARSSGTNEFLNLGNSQLLTPSADLVAILAPQPGENATFLWETLFIPADSRRAQYLDWLRENGVDLMYEGDGKIIGFDGTFAIAHGDSSTNWDDWDDLTPEQALAAVASVNWQQRMARGEVTPKPPGDYSSAAQLAPDQPGRHTVNLLARNQSVNWFFKTRSGAVGILQLVSLTDDTAKVRYKLLQTDAPNGGHPFVHKSVLDRLNERLDAATSMSDSPQKNQSLAAIALDAARVGAPELTSKCLDQINDQPARDQTAAQAALALSGAGQHKAAIDLAKTIDSDPIRNTTLSQLAQ
jgi:predicted Ser/Thr protein kinase